MNNKTVYDDSKIKSITKTGLMAAIIFIGTYIIKIPSLHGYTHLGDCLVFTAVYLLGTKRGAIAGGLGEALSDLLGGYAAWILPTFFIKFIMAAITGIFTYKLMPKFKYGWLVGAVSGGIIQVILYTLVKIPLYDMAYALTGLPKISAQSIIGIILASVIITVFNKAGLSEKFREV